MHRRRVLPHRGANRTQDNPPQRPPATHPPAPRASRPPQRIHRTRTRRTHHTPTPHTPSSPETRRPWRALASATKRAVPFQTIDMIAINERRLRAEPVSAAACPQRRLARRGLDALVSGTAQRLGFDREGDGDGLLRPGLACGSRPAAPARKPCSEQTCSIQSVGLRTARTPVVHPTRSRSRVP